MAVLVFTLVFAHSRTVSDISVQIYVVAISQPTKSLPEFDRGNMKPISIMKCEFVKIMKIKNYEN